MLWKGIYARQSARSPAFFLSEELVVGGFHDLRGLRAGLYRSVVVVVVVVVCICGSTCAD